MFYYHLLYGICRYTQYAYWAVLLWDATILSIGPLGTNFSKIEIKIQNFSFGKKHLKISSAKWRPFCPGRDHLTLAQSLTLPVASCFYANLTSNTLSFSSASPVYIRDRALTVPGHQQAQCWLQSCEAFCDISLAIRRWFWSRFYHWDEIMANAISTNIVVLGDAEPSVLFVVNLY